MHPIQTELPPSAPRLKDGISSKICLWCLRTLGWTLSGELDDEPKLIAIGAPHTSNWDWVLAILLRQAANLRFSYMIKSAAFFWPLSIILRSTDAIPIDRKQTGGMVEQMTAEFERNEQLYLAITPEGTRKAVRHWKTGFLRLAYAGNIPIATVAFDYERKTVVLGRNVKLSGDLDKDMEVIQNYFKQYRGKHPRG